MDKGALAAFPERAFSTADSDHFRGKNGVWQRFYSTNVEWILSPFLARTRA